jgi:hypothetical protein
MLACIKQFDSNNSTLSIEIEYDAVRDFLAIDNRNLGKSHIECVGLGIVTRPHRVHPCQFAVHYNTMGRPILLAYPSPLPLADLAQHLLRMLAETRRGARGGGGLAVEDHRRAHARNDAALGRVARPFDAQAAMHDLRV